MKSRTKGTNVIDTDWLQELKSRVQGVAGWIKRASDTFLRRSDLVEERRSGGIVRRQRGRDCSRRIVSGA